MVRVRVHPIDGSIAQSFIERLLMFDVDLCLDEADVEVVRQQHATLLEGPEYRQCSANYHIDW